jgi:hypothetical protein
MREGLAREFPDAPRVVAWTRDRIGGRRGLVRSEPVVWATISGIGAGFIVGSVAQALVGLANEAALALRAQPPFALFPLIAISGTAAAAAVALRAGGPVPLALYLVFIALGIMTGIPGRITACDRSGGGLPFPGPDQCSALGFLAAQWPVLIGIGIGLVIARGLTTRGAGINSILRVAGTLAVALFVVSLAWAASVAQAGYVAEPDDAFNSGLTLGAGTVAAAVAAGVIAAQIPRGIRSAAMVALIWMLPWFASQLFYASRSLTSPIAPENVAPIVAGLLTQPVAVAFLLLSAAVAARSRFIPRASA